MKILIVDDNRDTLELCRVLFRQTPIEVLTFERSTEALEYLNGEDGGAVDACLLDLSMPTLEGLTMAEQIRQNEEINRNGKPLKLAFYTAGRITEAIERIGARARVEKIFCKPDDTPDLAEKVAEWLTA